MLRSPDRIVVSHAGTLPRPDSVARLFDVVNDGEFSKRGGFSGYVRNRISGIQPRQVPAGEGPRGHDVTARDRREFPGAFAAGVGPLRGGRTANQPYYCTQPLTYIGQANVENVIAGTDCGFGTRVGHPEIAWARLESLVEGARIATKQRWS